MSQQRHDIPKEYPILGLKVQGNSSSLRVTIPADVADNANVETGDRLEAKYNRENRTLTFYLN